MPHSHVKNGLDRPDTMSYLAEGKEESAMFDYKGVKVTSASPAPPPLSGPLLLLLAAAAPLREPLASTWRPSVEL